INPIPLKYGDLMSQGKPDPSERLRNILRASSEEKTGKVPSEAPSSPPSMQPPAAAPAADRSRTSGSATPRRSFAFLPAFWTVASIASMSLNIVLIVIVILLIQQIGTVNGALNFANNLLSGLYGNFEKMYQAHIRTTIPVSTRVPVELEVCIRRETNVSLTQDVGIVGARVTVQSGGLSITNAYTNIRLPGGVVLPIALDLCVPVQAEIPVNINVQTDIPIAETELGAPIQGLMETIRPIYCLITPDARDSQGKAICK
ncbi:MAG: hypothetical protein ACK8QZ_02970, partial [Anaerolineales bacterium]